MIKLRRSTRQGSRELQYVFEAFVIEEIHRLRSVEELPHEDFIEIVKVARDRVHQHDLAGGQVSTALL